MRLGTYELLDLLGRGGTGSVYRARAADGRVVAVKALARRDEAARGRFERETRLLRDLGGLEGFVPLLDAGAAPEGLWFAMPLLAGGTLRDRLRTGPLDVAETIALGEALARALALAHEKGIVHRDLKPENVLFDAEGRPLVADLGLGKHFDRDVTGGARSVSLSADGAFLGTAGYMAPEQVDGARDVGPPADVFAWGAIVYECLAGEPAFRGETVLDVLARLATGRIDPFRRRDVPRWLDATIRKALARDPRDRFATGAALAQALRERGARPPRRWPLVAASLVVALLGLGAAFAFREACPPGPPSAARSPDYSGVLTAAEVAARARAKLAAGDAAGARDEGSAAIALDPNVAPAWRERGRARRALGDREGALADVERAIALDARDGAARAERALLRFDGGAVKDGYEDALRAVELAPDLAVARIALSVARDAKGDANGAEREAERAAELGPREVAAWLQVGAIRSRRGDHEGALRAFTTATALAPSSLAAWQGRTAACINKHDWLGTVAQTTSAIALFPKAASFRIERARARLRLEDPEAAIVDCTKALELEPRSKHALYQRGVAHEKLDDTAAAIADFEAIVNLDPTSHDAKNARERLQRLKPSR